MHVSVTSQSVDGLWGAMLFFRHALPLLARARKAPGNLFVGARLINGVPHTLTCWEDRATMREFFNSSAHQAAMKVAGRIGKSASFGFEAQAIPDWDEALGRWRAHQNRD